MNGVEQVLLSDRDSDDVPPSHVLVLQAMTQRDGWPPIVYFQTAAYDENNTSSSMTRLATTCVDLDILVGSLNLLFGADVLVIDRAGLESVTPS